MIAFTAVTLIVHHVLTLVVFGLDVVMKEAVFNCCNAMTTEPLRTAKSPSSRRGSGQPL